MSGRFDEAVIEERRKAAEDMLQFTTSIAALYNSPQLKDFFRVGDTLYNVSLTLSVFLSFHRSVSHLSGW